jgi:deoxyhypusine synthase
VTWGKINRDTYMKTTESLQADYSIVMPFLVRALLENRKRYEQWAARMGEEELFKRHPKARGYLRPREGYRLFDQRTALCDRLLGEVKKNREWLLETLRYPLAAGSS